jgi:hypothetical protein
MEGKIADGMISLDVLFKAEYIQVATKHHTTQWSIRETEKRNQ